MKQTRLLMGMPITVEIVDNSARVGDFDMVYDYFSYVDNVFSPYKPESEISRIRDGKLSPSLSGQDIDLILRLAQETKNLTGGYFDIYRNGRLDPSGIVKGWTINNAANLLKKNGFSDFYVDAGGDIQVSGKNSHGQNWRVGIRHPQKKNQIVKVLSLTNEGVATSGTYERGNHIYNPKIQCPLISDVISLTVIGPNVYEADRFATAAFAMGKKGIGFIEKSPGLEGYMIDKDGIATITTGFSRYTVPS